MSPTVLMTGFEPFADDATNPSWDAVSRLGEERGNALRTARLPCAFDTAIPALLEAVDRHSPDLVICVGLAGGRPAITPERVAINIDDARIGDNAGQAPVDVPVVADGPAAYFSTLPVKACVAGLRRAGIPAEVSQTAGTFVCNHVFYGLMHLIATGRPGMRGGFVHVPYAPEQVVGRAEPSMSIETMVRGLGVIASTALATPRDIVAPGGAEH